MPTSDLFQQSQESQQTLQALRAEINRLNKVVKALMNRAERSASMQGSDFSLFQTAIVLKEEVRHRTQDMEKALRENEKINRSLQHAKAQMELEIQERKRAEDEVLQHNIALTELNNKLSETHRQLKESEERFRHLAELSSDWYWEQDENFRFTTISSSVMTKSGIPTFEFLGKTRWELPNDLDQSEWLSHKIVLEEHQKFTDFEYKTTFRSNAPLWFSTSGEPLIDANGTFKGYRGTAKNITDRKQTEERIRHMALHDPLTGLPNRALLADRLSQAISYSSRYNHLLWVLFLDLDRFKFINDSLGHKAGDRLLNIISKRLQSTIRETDTIARLGGDEFVLVLPERLDENLTTYIVQRIMNAVAQPLVLEGQEFFLSCSIGVAVYPIDGSNAETLVEHADVAMYRAKKSGRNNFQFYTQAMNEEVLERLRMERALRNALERDEFSLYYQPQVDLHNGKIVATEAMLRWQQPELGVMSSTRFISLAEETGLIIPIGAWMLRAACTQNKIWQNAGFSNLRIAVNLSAHQFLEKHFAQSIVKILKETGLAPESLEIGLTESSITTDMDRIIIILQELKEIGVQLSIDNFGKGHLNLSHLKKFPVNKLKIDPSFVRGITSLNQNDEAIVTSIISLAHNLHMQVVAEGVETQGQLNYLKQQGCNAIQGPYFGSAVSASVFEKMMCKNMEETKNIPTLLNAEL